MTSMSKSSQDQVCGKTNSQKSIKYLQCYDVVCQLALLGGKGLSNNDFMKCFQSLSIARVDWRSLSNKNDILQSCDNLFQYAKSRHTDNIRYASKQNFCRQRVRTNTGKQMFSYKAIDLWNDIPLYLKDLSTFSFAKEVKQYLLSKQYSYELRKNIFLS